MKPLIIALACLVLQLSAPGGDVVLQEDFADSSLAAWQVIDVGTQAAPSRWTASLGAVHQATNIYTRAWNGDRTADWTGSYLMHRSCTFADGEAEMAFWSTDDDGVGFAWHMRDKDNLCKVQLNATPPFWQVSRTVDGKFRCIATGTTGYRMGELHRLRVRSAYSMTAIELDGRLLFVGTVDGPESGSVAIESRGNQGTHADYVRVTSGKPWTDQELGSLRELHVMRNARLEHLAVLPGETLRLELPDTSDSTAVVRADGRELARAPLSGKRIDLWRNPGGMDTLGEVVLVSGGREARVLPFNIWTAWPKGIGVCAHRGDNHMAPENTVAAIRLAVQKRAHEIEIDVTRTKDGHLVLLHDLTLDRTTDGTGKPQDYTLAELKQLDAGSWKDATWKGTRIPTLEEALAEIPDGIWVNLHLKTGVAEDVTRLVTRLGRTQWCFLACSQAEATRARTINPDILVCNMDGQAGPSSTYPRRTMDMKADFLQFHGFDETMPRVARELADHGVRRNYFPANDPAFFRRLLEAGVEFPLTDRLDTMLGVLDEIGVPPPL